MKATQDEESPDDPPQTTSNKFPASGWMCCFPFAVSTAALALSFVASGACNLVTLGNSDYFPLPAKSIGLWCYATLGGSTYSTINAPFDSKFDAARGCATATLILGIIVWLFYCFAGCCPFTFTIFRIVGFLAVCNTIFQALVFLVLQSEFCSNVGCQLDTASYCAIAASILWFLAGIMSCIAGKPVEEIPPDEEELNDEEGQEEDGEKYSDDEDYDEEDDAFDEEDEYDGSEFDDRDEASTEEQDQEQPPDESEASDREDEDTKNKE